MHKLIDQISSVLSGMSVSEADNRWLTTLTAVTLSLLVAWIIYQILNRLVGKYISKLVKYTAITWDDILFSPKVLRSVWRFVLAMILSVTLPGAVSLYSGWVKPVTGLCQIMLVMSSVMIAVRVVGALHDIILESDRFKDHSIKGIFQMIQLMLILLGVIIIISIIIGRDPIFIISGLGAAAAVIMLVFQDTILGLVAGIQLSANDMLRPGDWISAPKFNVNGIVREVTLTTVKVQNYDNTIVTVPPYALVKDSFQNWRGMWDAKGRRVMRYLTIDMSSVRMLTPEEIEQISSMEWVDESVREMLRERPINLSLFRRYIGWLIARVPTLRDDMTSMVRELQPTPEGIPVEVYFYSADTNWVNYEILQADFFDYLLASLTTFGLRVYQRPSAHDMQSIGRRSSVN